MKIKEYKAFYEKLTSNLKENPNTVKTFTLANQILTYLFVYGYVLFLGYVAFSKPFSLVAIISKTGIPALCFGVVTLIRKLINRPRPYEATGAGLDPIIKRKGVGLSMPSRHVASAFVIAMVILSRFTWFGIFGILAAIALAFLRLLEGVHYPSDILAGALIGVAFGAIGFIF